jgi:hypothetical protein
VSGARRSTRTGTRAKVESGNEGRVTASERVTASASHHGLGVTHRCLLCGKQLPPSGPASRFIARFDGTPSTRSDRKYCCNAHRQAAYRQRRKAGSS